MIKLKPEFKSAWTADLRSGEYKQGQHVLHNVTNDTLCCLGVACVVANKMGAEISTQASREMLDGCRGVDVIAYGHTENTGDLPNEAIYFMWNIPEGGADSEALANLRNPDVSVADEFGDIENLATLNDSGRYSFSQLADIIQQDF